MFTIIKPDDMHVHLRDGEMLKLVAPQTAKQFARAVVMPNLLPPVTTTKLALEYKSRIKVKNFTPLMTLYLTDNTSAAEISKAKAAGIIGVKYYPAGATTNSDSGVTNIKKTYKALAEMERVGMPLLLHGEVTDKQIDVFDRESVFIEKILKPLIKKFPKLKIVFEHITTKQAAEFVAANKNVFATITAHHLLYNRNSIFAGGIRPHYYCLPILKREEHRKALVKAALSNSGKFFAGTDSAPHLREKKESACGCAGCFTAPIALELYAQVFDTEDLSKIKTQKKFENFMSKFGADFYGLPYNTQKISLKKQSQKVPEKTGDVVNFLAGEQINWSFVNA